VAFAYYSNVILLSRLIFTFKDEHLSTKQAVAMLIIQAVGLLALEVGPPLFLLAATLGVIGAGLAVVENRLGQVKKPRVVSLVIYFAALNVFFSPSVGLELRPRLDPFIQSIGSMFSVLARGGTKDWLRFHITLAGALLVINEVNTLVRYLFQAFDLEPTREPADEEDGATLDEKEYKAGRVIGILERILVYHLVLQDQYAAIGLVLAAKSFTRFKELERRRYAEYVLIGTLASTLLAMLVAAAVEALLP
jgi:hypothetical protein